MKKIFAFAFFVFFACASIAQTRVMTFNIRYDNPYDGDNGWSRRKGEVVETIRKANADIVGTQEVLHHQFCDLKDALSDYAVVGVGREDGACKGEYEALWFKKEKFDSVATGHFWLSQWPDSAGSLGWDGACVRMASWALLRDKCSGKELLAVNTHLDHVGPVARREGVRLICQRLQSIAPGRPAVVMGDFNSGPSSAPVAFITSDDSGYRLCDSRRIAAKVQGPAWTFHNFGRLEEMDREIIDFIFTTPGVEVDNYQIIDNTVNAPMSSSDHCPVVVDIKM